MSMPYNNVIHPEKTMVIADERIILFFKVSKSEMPVLFPTANPTKEKILTFNKSSLNTDEYNGIAFVKNKQPAT
jgi:hypothetical protein